MFCISATVQPGISIAALPKSEMHFNRSVLKDNADTEISISMLI
jgi:hypothetical protein